MKRFRWIGAAALTLPLVAHGALVWRTQQLDVEAPANAREIAAHYPFENTGRRPVTITEIVSSCDCTTTELVKRTYAPGEHGVLTARLRVGGEAGAQENTLAVITDDPSAAPAILRLRSTVRSLVKLPVAVLSWSVGVAPDEASALVAAASPLRIASLAVTNVHPAGAATSRIETVARGTEFRVHVRPATTVKPANFAIACSATFEDGSSQNFALYGSVRHEPAGQSRRAGAPP